MNAILRRFSWALLGRLAGALVYALSFLLLARWTSVEDFGRYSGALAMVSLSQVVMDFGLSTYVIRLRAAHSSSGEIGDCLRYNNLSCLTFLVVGVSSLVLAGGFFNLLVPVVVWACLEKMADVWLGVYQGDGRNRDIALHVFRRRVLALLIFIFLYVAGVPALFAFGLGLAASALLAYLRVSAEIRPLLAPRSREAWQVVLSRGRPYWVNSIAVQLRTLDVMLVTALAGPAQAAYFAVANRLVTPLSMLPSSLATILMPSVSKGELGQGAAFRATIAMTAIASVPLLLIIVLAPLCVPPLLGNDYRPAVPVLQIICVGMVFLSASSMLIAILQGIGRARYVARMSAALSIGYLLFLPMALRAGAVGAAVALAAMFLVRALVSFRGLRLMEDRAFEAR